MVTMVLKISASFLGRPFLLHCLLKRPVGGSTFRFLEHAGIQSVVGGEIVNPVAYIRCSRSHGKLS